jgi:hypothetical protein
VKWAKRVVWLTIVVSAFAAPAAAPLAGCGGCDTRITTAALPDGMVGVFYQLQLHSDCGGDVWFLDEGNLPPGVGLLDNGKLRGVPTVAGAFSFTIGVVDFGSGDRASKGFLMTVLEAGP